MNDGDGSSSHSKPCSSNPPSPKRLRRLASALNAVKMLLCIVGQVAPGPVGQASRAGGELIQRGQDVAETDEGNRRLGERVSELELEIALATEVDTTFNLTSASDSTTMRLQRSLRNTAEEVALQARRRLISRFASALEDVRGLTTRIQRVDSDAIDLAVRRCARISLSPTQVSMLLQLVTSLNTRREVQDIASSFSIVFASELKMYLLAGLVG